MNSVFNKLSILFVLSVTFGLSSLVYFPSPILASTSTISATVAEQSFTSPILLNPAADSSINTNRPTFSWSRPSPLPTSPLNHYDFYLDGAVFASSVADSVSSADFYFYSVSGSGGNFYVSLKTNLTQGYHTWKVIAYNDAGISASSETRTFYVDSISPFISVTKVDAATLTWNTDIPASIPEVQNRYLTVTTTNPLVKGGVELAANIKIVLLCPQNIPSCTNQSLTTNSPTGSWEHRFGTLLSDKVYTVQISATDASGNSTLFPNFFLTYTTRSTFTPTPTTPKITSIPTASPTPAAPVSETTLATPSALPPLPLPSSTLTPPPGLMAIISPAPFDYSPPPAPTPPPAKPLRSFQKETNLFKNFLYLLIIFGLPTHLSMAAFGSRTPIQFLFKFLLILAFPFLRSKRYRTIPFSFITIFVPDKLDYPWQSVVSDIHGYFNLKNPIPEKVFISLTTFGHTWKNNLFKGVTISNSCLYPLPERHQDARDRFLKLIYDTRIIPLVIACLTSTAVLFIQPSYPVLVYTYFSLQYFFSEYIYPKI